MGARNNFVVSFLQRGTRRVVDIDSCPIATPAINEAYEKARKLIFETIKTTPPKKGATLLFREGNNGVETKNNNFISETVDGIDFEYRAGEFFQNNPFVLPVRLYG